jgi:hypothetical protein
LYIDSYYKPTKATNYPNCNRAGRDKCNLKLNTILQESRPRHYDFTKLPCYKNSCYTQSSERLAMFVVPFVSLGHRGKWTPSLHKTFYKYHTMKVMFNSRDNNKYNRTTSIQSNLYYKRSPLEQNKWFFTRIVAIPNHPKDLRCSLSNLSVLVTEESGPHLCIKRLLTSNLYGELHSDISMPLPLLSSHMNYKVNFSCCYRKFHMN